jgi:ribosomal protein L28
MALVGGNLEKKVQKVMVSNSTNTTKRTFSPQIIEYKTNHEP